MDPADSDEVTAAVAPEQGGPRTAEGAAGDDPDVSPEPPPTEDAAPVIVWATPMGTPPVYPATEELEQIEPRESGVAATWHAESGAAGEAGSDVGEVASEPQDPPTAPAAAAGEPTHASDHAPPVRTTSVPPLSATDAEVLERLAARIRSGAPVGGGGDRRESAVLARLLAGLLAADEAVSSRQAPPGPAGVEL